MFERWMFRALPVLFAWTLFLGAALLFLVELMLARMLLPLFGGSPAVWNTCMLVFQALLLLGYGYAHVSGTRAGPARQMILHLTLLGVASLFVPVSLSRVWDAASGGHPIVPLVLLLIGTVGLPFLVLASSSPVLQHWFVRTGHPAARDPYFLYSAGNLGSMLALIGYPILIEPHLGLAAQRDAWAVGYLLFLLGTLLCAGVTRRYGSHRLSERDGAIPQTEPCASGGASRPSRRERGRWVLLAFVPSSLLLGVTTFLTTNIAAVPLFWIIPLALYLLSFIIVFARVSSVIHAAMVRLMPLAIIALVVVGYADLGLPKWGLLAVHLVTFFIVCMVCHGELARTRPAAGRLAEFYLWLAVGGVLGGVFNALIAPVAFSTVLEYPLILILGALLLPVTRRACAGRSARRTGLLPVIGVPLAMVPLTAASVIYRPVIGEALAPLASLLHVPPLACASALTLGALALACYALVFLKRPFLFGIGLASLLLTAGWAMDRKQGIIHRERGFFGVLTVTRNAAGPFTSLIHGTTLHGMQAMRPDLRHLPLTYYHGRGPVGAVFAAFRGERQKARLAVIGLGAGSLAAYAGRGQELDFYEIDPAVARLAADPAYFTFLSDCQAAWRVIIGDGRLMLARAPAHHYGLIVLDAFSSDAIPAHLLTQEAIALYFSKLTPDGALLIHISNSYVDLAPVLARAAEANGFAARLCNGEEDLKTARSETVWVLLARSERDLGALSRKANWKKIEPRRQVRAWTDDYSNILSVFKW